MKSNSQKIVSLADFKQARERIELKDIQDIIAYAQRELRELDYNVSTTIMKKHRLKDTEKLRKELAEINSTLLRTSHWLEDETVNVAEVQKAEKIDKLRKLNSQLLANSEVTRKVLVDDMANSRFYEQRWLPDPTRFISLVIGAPVGVALFADKFISPKGHIGVYFGEATIPVGLYLTFKSHADNLLMSAGRRIEKAPAGVRALVVSSALELSARTKSIKEVHPHSPNAIAGGDRMIIGFQR